MVEPNKGFKALEAEVKQFSADLVNIMNEHDTIDKSKLFPYRDVRFSKDKPHLKHILVFLFTVKACTAGRILSPHQTWDNFIATGFGCHVKKIYCVFEKKWK